MTAYEVNPFQELYVTDSPDPNVFVCLFSDYPVHHAQMLFRPGNVILKGTQGSGKSMLLNLFRPRIRLAYHNAGIKFPVPEELSQFITAGINLTRSGALDMGQRPISKESMDEESIFPLLFGDFLNYYIVRDILETLSIIKGHQDVFGKFTDIKKYNDFATCLAKEDCWFGTLIGCETFEELCNKIEDRIIQYRSFNLANSDLPEKINNTKTDIGEPIAKTSDCLKMAGVISDDIPIYIRIDQLERLERSDLIRKPLGKQYRGIINKALGKREQRVSYRIGTRRYAWEDNLYIYGTGDELENIRDFRICDLDNMLRRKEDTKTWIFPSFAEDAFTRRLRYSKLKSISGGDQIGKIFGSNLSPKDAANYYAGIGSAEKILKIDSKWPNRWKKYLKELFDDDKLEAMLASAWVRQRGTKGKPGRRLKEPPPIKTKPWEKTYWRKERIRQALMQIAARNQQRLQWCGKEQILALSSGNISVFLSICHEIWEAFLRFERRKKYGERVDPLQDQFQISPEVQAVAIHTASSDWYDKITELPGGDDRQAFIDVLGRTFRKWLLDDIAMSYPGHNGFSIFKDDLKKYNEIKIILEDAADYDDLDSKPHTTKHKDRRPRIKWYLSPILSVFFQIPESHVKEPYYLSNMDDIIKWLKEAKCLPGNYGKSDSTDKENQIKRKTKKKKPDKQMFFDFSDISKK